MAALGLRSGDSRVFSQSSGTRDSPADASRPRGRLCPGLAPPKAARGRRGGSVQLPHLPHGPACHTRTLPSAIGLGQLCPPEIITSFLLLLLLVLLLQSPSPPRPCGGPSGISPSPAQLCTLGAPRLRLHSRSHRPRLQCLSCCYLSFAVDLGWLGEGEVRWGSPDPGVGSWCSWKEQLCSQPSSHQHLRPGAAVPHPLCSRGSPCSPGLRALAPPRTITSVPQPWFVPS